MFSFSSRNRVPAQANPGRSKAQAKPPPVGEGFVLADALALVMTRSDQLFLARRARIRVRTDEMAYAPPANPARIRVGFSGESSHPPWARAGIAAIIANARAVRRKVFFIGRSYFRRDPGALGCER